MATHGSSVGAGGTGSQVYGSNLSAAISVLNITKTLVADAYAAPADIPTADQLRVQRDAAGKRGIWDFSLDAENASAGTGWKAVSLT